MSIDACPLPVHPFASVASIVNENEPAADAVPEMVPVVSANPGGSEPAVTANEYGVTPPLAATVSLYGTANVPPACVVETVIAGATATPVSGTPNCPPLL